MVLLMNAIITLIFFCGTIFMYSQSKDKVKLYGDNFNINNELIYESVKSDFYKNTKTKIKGEILATCPMKGCWMKMSVAEDTLFVRFKDYGFFVPKTGAEGKSAIVNGYLSIDTLSVKQLRHYAEDTGKNEEEILKIKEPEITLSFMADGVIILDKT